MLESPAGTESREVDERYQVLFAKSKVPMLLIDPQDGSIVDANEAACQYYGYGTERIRSMHITDINTFSPEQVKEEMQRAAREQRSHFYFRHRLAGGEIRDVEVHSGPLTINGQHLLYSVIHDITERREAERALRESESRFRNIMEHAPLGLVITDLEGRFIQVNQALCDIVGLQRDAFDGLTINDITYPDDRAISKQYLQSLLDENNEVIKYEKRYVRTDGRPVWVQLSVTLERDSAGTPLYFISLVEDISRRKEAEQRISFLAHHDRLTELPNRELFSDRLARSIAHAKRRNKLLALFFLDLDGFKAVNDNFGHAAGDTVLQAVAKRMLACVRDVDTVARVGGDEFAIVFEEIEKPLDVAVVAEKIIQQLSAPVALPDGRECHVGVSIGIAIYPDNGRELDRLMSAADDAMYASKRHGKSTYTYSKDGLHTGNHPWIEAYVLGEPETDRQHQILVRILNELNDAVRRNDPPGNVAQLFDELIAAAESHFAVEEQMMDKYAYPERTLHADEHRRLLQEAHYLKEKLAQGGELLVLQSLKDWLLAHTLHVDKSFVDYLARHGVLPRHAGHAAE
ncbi:MAG: bacteriohemerythrin [Sideroxydans sp.]|nr:bacteriohemerythrin [Sideroxydans sp.]